MTRDRIDDALDGMSARELEAMRVRIDRRLLTCAIDGADGAIRVACRTEGTSGKYGRFTLLLCPSCIERYRRPIGRWTSTD